MKTLNRFIAQVALVLGAGVAAAEPITMRLGFALNGPPPELVAAIREGVALQAKINPGVGHELWLPVAHGSNMNAAQLIVYYDSAEHFAEATMREEASAEWSAFLASFPNNKFPTVHTSISSVLVRAPGFEPAKGGEVQVVVGFKVSGPISDLVARINEGSAIQQRVNPQATLSLVVPFLNGEDVDRAAVLVRYPTLEAWAEGRSKMQASSEWSEFISQPPAASTLVYQGLSQAAKIQ